MKNEYSYPSIDVCVGYEFNVISALHEHLVACYRGVDNLKINYTNKQARKLKIKKNIDGKWS